MVFGIRGYDVWKYFDNLVEEGVAVCKLCKQRLKNDRNWTLKKHLTKLHNTKREIWNYFDNIVGEGMAVCKQCKQRVRNNRSSNLTQHLEKAHNIIVLNIEGGTKKRKKKGQEAQTSNSGKCENVTDTVCITDEDEEQPAQTNQAEASSIDSDSAENVKSVTGDTPVVTNTTPIVSSIGFGLKEDRNHNAISAPKRNIRRSPDGNASTSKRAKTHSDIAMTEKTLMSAVWGLMIEDGVTPALFGSQNMQTLLQPIYHAIFQQEGKELKIDEAESEKLLCLVANHMRHRFSNDLDWRLLSLKIAKDLNGPANTFCVSALFIDCGQIQTRILGVIDLMDDYQLTEQHIKQVLHKFNIDSNQIISINWDNTKSNYNTQVTNSEYLKQIEKFESYPDIQFGVIKLERYVGVMAQLCLLDLFKNSEIFQPFLECRNFAKFINHQSNGYYEIFEQNNLTIPQLDSPWKWGSTYKMIQDLHEARSILKDANIPKFERPEDQFIVNDNLWQFIEAFYETISFMQKSIVKYYNEEMHFGDFYTQWLKSKLLIGKLAAARNAQNTYITIISTKLLQSIEARSTEILAKDSFAACLYLDPRFHHTLGAPEKTKAVEYLKGLWSRSKIYNADVINAAAQENAASQRFNDDEDAFLNEFLCQDTPELDVRSTDVHKKIESLKLTFKPVDTNVLSFWNKQKLTDPELYSLSTICFAVPTTQKYNENRYTHIYQREALSKLSTFTRDNLVSIRLNAHLLEGDLEQFGIFHEATSSDEEGVQIIDSNEATTTSF